LPDVPLALEPGERPCWHRDGALPLSVRVAERLGNMLILAGELQADLASDEVTEIVHLLP